MNNIEMNPRRIEDMRKELESRAQKKKAAIQEDEYSEADTERLKGSWGAHEAQRMDPAAIDQMCGEHIVGCLEALQRSKPNDRSERDRRYAILITKMEDVEALFYRHISKR